MKKWIVSVFSAGLAAAAVLAAEAPLKVGDLAPAVVGKDHQGKEWKLADHLKQGPVLLYFYPKDNTPGCTRQACGLRDRMPDLQKAGVTVVGVSFDSAESHQKFMADHQLNFTLLTDPEGKIADAFGARIPGQKMARRVSFLISRDGVIRHITDTPKAETHLEEMTAAVQALKK
ncbi:MAG: peroxiredoxin [Verrucomicrobiae bacterium]|nr:peroxiredoxin [Verrucomicrobiae bacterium]